MTAASPAQRPSRFFRRATFWVPTRRGWLAAALLLALLIVGPIRRLHQFLSVQTHVPADVLVVEGWLPDYALQQALAEFQQGGYRYLVASGGPMERGSLVSGYPTYAAIAAATLQQLGAPPDKLLQAPAPKTLRHRTYQSATSVRDLMAERGLHATGVTVVSEGPHARRTLVVYQKALANTCQVGVLAIRPRNYDPDHWWRSSDGVKITLTEALGWIYEALWSSGR